jgi:hypothetical protein
MHPTNKALLIRRCSPSSPRSPSQDVYSFSILLYTLLSGRVPWQGLPAVVIAFRAGLMDERPPLSAVPADRLPHKLHKLLLACWDSDHRAAHLRT